MKQLEQREALTHAHVSVRSLNHVYARTMTRQYSSSWPCEEKPFVLKKTRLFSKKTGDFPGKKVYEANAVTRSFGNLIVYFKHTTAALTDLTETGWRGNG